MAPRMRWIVEHDVAFDFFLINPHTHGPVLNKNFIERMIQWMQASTHGITTHHHIIVRTFIGLIDHMMDQPRHDNQSVMAAIIFQYNYTCKHLNTCML